MRIQYSYCIRLKGKIKVAFATPPEWFGVLFARRYLVRTGPLQSARKQKARRHRELISPLQPRQFDAIEA